MILLSSSSRFIDLHHCHPHLHLIYSHSVYARPLIYPFRLCLLFLIVHYVSILVAVYLLYEHRQLTSSISMFVKYYGRAVLASQYRDSIFKDRLGAVIMAFPSQAVLALAYFM